MLAGLPGKLDERLVPNDLSLTSVSRKLDERLVPKLASQFKGIVSRAHRDDDGLVPVEASPYIYDHGPNKRRKETDKAAISPDKIRPK